MQDRARDYMLPITLVLTGVSYALVFGAVLQLIPPTWLPHVDDAVLAVIPHVNAVISLLAISTITGGWLMIRRGRVRTHRALMLTATALFAGFLTLYLYRIILAGTTAFPGPTPVYRYVYLPLLGTHILLAIICIPLVFYVLVIGLTHRIPDIPRTNHPRVGQIAALLWLVSFTLGVTVYLLLHWIF